MTLRTRTVLPLLFLAATSVGCQHPYSWDVDAPPVSTAVQDQSCGQTMQGVMSWYEIDAEVYPEWVESCSLEWEISGELLDEIDPGCEACRCEYAGTVTLRYDTCEWYDEGTEFDYRLGLTPTINGPSDYQGYASDWPWLGYSDLEPAWAGSVAPVPSEETGFVYIGKEDENALTQSFDAGEYLLSAYYFQWAPNGEDKVDNYAAIGLSH